ncbi:hypothetical protein H4219_003015 [Mycoemilia scoparia]|uniref:Uncharacterized protein n=1 Tax=Mycoemilia scoparia TaxID=417184 RepID=A0A9W8DTL4_9FUNG|nr:hypothetical protein H4219_003015 [Mycoemilia scoparia]
MVIYFDFESQYYSDSELDHYHYPNSYIESDEYSENEGGDYGDVEDASEGVCSDDNDGGELILSTYTTFSLPGLTPDNSISQALSENGVSIRTGGDESKDGQPDGSKAYKYKSINRLENRLKEHGNEESELIYQLANVEGYEYTDDCYQLRTKTITIGI